MHRAKLAKWLLVTAAVSTLTIPIGVDGRFIGKRPYE